MVNVFTVNCYLSENFSNGYLKNDVIINDDNNNKLGIFQLKYDKIDTYALRITRDIVPYIKRKIDNIDNYIFEQLKKIMIYNVNKHDAVIQIISNDYNESSTKYSKIHTINLLFFHIMQTLNLPIKKALFDQTEAIKLCQKHFSLSIFESILDNKYELNESPKYNDVNESDYNLLVDMYKKLIVNYDPKISIPNKNLHIFVIAIMISYSVYEYITNSNKTISPFILISYLYNFVGNNENTNSNYSTIITMSYGIINVL